MTNEHESIDLLLSRLVGGDASGPEWDRFSTEAEGDPTLWRRLALAQRDHDELADVVNAAVAVADDVPLPEAADVSVSGDAPGRREPGTRSSRWRFPVLAWTGWAAAAVVTFVAVVAFQAGDSMPVADTPTKVAEGLTPEEALQRYLEVGQRTGQVVGEMPTRVLVDQRPLPEGGYELLFARQILESQRVPELYQFAGQEENGQPTFIRYPGPRGSGGM